MDFDFGTSFVIFRGNQSRVVVQPNIKDHVIGHNNCMGFHKGSLTDLADEWVFGNLTAGFFHFTMIFSCINFTFISKFGNAVRS